MVDIVKSLEGHINICFYHNDSQEKKINVHKIINNYISLITVIGDTPGKQLWFAR